MTELSLNQQVKPMSFSPLLKVFFFCLLPLIYYADGGAETISSHIWTIGAIWLAILYWYRNELDDILDYQAFIMRVKAGHEFKLEDAHKNLARFPTTIYRIDSKKRQIQFFVGEKKYIMLITAPSHSTTKNK